MNAMQEVLPPVLVARERVVRWTLGTLLVGMVLGFLLAVVWLGVHCEAGMWDLHVLD